MKYKKSDISPPEQAEDSVFDRFIRAVTANELRSTLKSLEENPGMRHRIITKLTSENPGLLLEIHRPDEPETELLSPELSRNHLLDGLVVIFAILEARIKRAEIEGLADLLWPDGKEAA